MVTCGTWWNPKNKQDRLWFATYFFHANVINAYYFLLMARSKFILTILLPAFVSQFCFSQEEVLPEACGPIKKTAGIDSTEKARLIKRVRAADIYLCRSLEEKSGFAGTADSLMKITTLQEKQDLFNDGTAVLKFRLFTVILQENDSLGFDLLKRSIKDTAELTAFCSCMIEEPDLNLSLVNYYLFFIQLKYQWGVGGTKGGRIVWFNSHSKKPDKKKWKMKLHELKVLVRNNVDADKLKSYYPKTGKELMD